MDKIWVLLGLPLVKISFCEGVMLFSVIFKTKPLIDVIIFKKMKESFNFESEGTHPMENHPQRKFGAQRKYSLDKD